jgi:hypothetical protein
LRPGRGYGGLKSDELFAKAEEREEAFLIRIAQNRMTVENKRILNETRKKRRQGRVGVTIPRDSRSGIQEREAVLQTRYAPFTVRRPRILNPVKTPPESVEVTVIYVKEEHPPKGNGPIEWLLMASEPITTAEEAYTYVGYYMQRWKTERFHYVLKSGCAIEKLQERSMGKTAAPILMRSIIAGKPLNMAYMGRLKPDVPCSVLLGPDEWKPLYCIANKTQKEPNKPYMMKEAVEYLGWLGGPKRAPSDGPPGVKTIWIGLMKLYILPTYREYLA